MPVTRRGFFGAMLAAAAAGVARTRLEIPPQRTQRTLTAKAYQEALKVPDPVAAELAAIPESDVRPYYSTKGAKIGDTVRVRLPQRWSLADEIVEWEARRWRG